MLYTKKLECVFFCMHSELVSSIKQAMCKKYVIQENLVGMAVLLLLLFPL